MKISVASNNPVKKEAFRLAFSSVFPDRSCSVKGFCCPSGIDDQPIGQEYTLSGAMNRLSHLKQISSDADFFASIEGGIFELEDSLHVFAWIVIEHGNLRSKNMTATFCLPPSLSKLVREGKELGDADDIIFNRTNSKQGDGTVGILTNQLITRATYYEHAAILALIPFISRFKNLPNRITTGGSES